MQKACSGCSKNIEGNTYKVQGSIYCRDCYVCGSCKKKLTGTFLPAGEHSFLCQSCHTCTTCKKPIAPGDEHFVFGAGVRLHAKCLSCIKCGKALSSKKMWRDAAGLPACEAHNGA